MTNQELALMKLVIECLEYWTTDDHYVEMVEYTKKIGYKDFEGDLEALKAKLNSLLT